MSYIKQFFSEWQEEVATPQQLQLPLKEQMRLAQEYLDARDEDIEYNHLIVSRYYNDCE